ncbi:uncharacterized protein LOC126570722 [Anopheles aquasalis]|uniref:uncharacterized protein LOC126570722 n=1 Tax=Anopheles aquasalis TaxID=42839 RepID=UPI00215AAA56|nr:uncharacterized protein LOC126570722 [Anopheles aquasalis]
MELQNQIYVIISVFASLVILLLILIVLLSIYVKKSIQMISTKKENVEYSNNGLLTMNKHAVQSRNSDTRGSLNLGYASEIHKSEDGYKGIVVKSRNYDNSETSHTYDDRGYRKEIAFGKQVPERRNDIRPHDSTQPDAAIAGKHFSMVCTDTDGSNIFQMDGYGEASDGLESANARHNVRYVENRRTKSSPVESETISTNNSRVKGRPNTNNGRSNHHPANKNKTHKDVVDTFDERNPSCYYARDTHDANISFYERGVSY